MAFPQYNRVPAHLLQLQQNIIIAFLIALYLGNPKLSVGLGYFTTVTAFRRVGLKVHIMAMPKAPIYKDAGPVTAQYNIRLARQSGMVQSISISVTPEKAAHNHFRLSIAAMDCRHIKVPLLRSNSVCHDGYLLSMA